MILKTLSISINGIDWKDCKCKYKFLYMNQTQIYLGSVWLKTSTTTKKQQTKQKKNPQKMSIFNKLHR